MAGFGFAETMAGTWTRTDGGRGGGRFEFSVTAASGPLREFGRTRQARITGTVVADGLAAGGAVQGTMELRPWLGRIIRYQFEFTGDDGQRYAFSGQKDIRWLHPVRTWTELPGQVTDAGGRVIGNALTRFDLKRQSASFVRSFRLA
jgi:hypothetical protein